MRHPRNFRRPSRAVIALATSAAFMTVPAFAQTPGKARVQNATSPIADGTDEGVIVVTAQRQSQDLQDVPVSLSVVSGEDLNSRQINDLSGVALAAPSLQAGADRNFAVRGVGTLSFSNTIDNSVAIAIDEVNLGRPVFSFPMLMDVARVEVLNGPQGLLFGKNASAGLVNIVTQQPEIGIYSSNTDIQISNRATPGADRDAPSIIGKQVLNLPVSSNSALRLNMLYAYEESPVTNVVPLSSTPIAFVNLPRRNIDANRNLQFKAKYLLESESGFSLNIVGGYNHIKSGIDRYNATYREFGAGSPREDVVIAAGVTPGPENFLDASDGGYFLDIKTGGLQATGAFEFDSGITISNIAAWRFADQENNLDVDANPADEVNNNYSDAKFRQFSNELRVTLPQGNRLTGQAGLFYFKSSGDEFNALLGNLGLPGFVLRGQPFCVGESVAASCGTTKRDFAVGRAYQARLDTESYAAFGQLNYDLTDTLQIYGGARVTRDEVSLDVTQGLATTFINFGIIPGRYTADTSNTNFSYKVGAQYEPTPDLMFYGFYGRGYKGPGFNTTAIADGAGGATVRPIDAETSDSFEVGFKSTFLDRRVTFNASAFFTKFDNFQVQSFNNDLRTFVVQNAAKVESKGVEATLNLRPTDGLTINTSASLLDAKYKSFAGGECYLGQPDPSCAVDNTFDAAGMSLPLSPKFTTSVQAIYEFAAIGSVTPFVQANWYHRSSVNYRINRAPGAELGPVDTFGFSGGVNIGDRLRASIFCNNCFNEIIPSNIATDSGEANDDVLTYNQRFGLNSVRQVGLSLRIDY